MDYYLENWIKGNVTENEDGSATFFIDVICKRIDGKKSLFISEDIEIIIASKNTKTEEQINDELKNGVVAFVAKTYPNT